MFSLLDLELLCLSLPLQLIDLSSFSLLFTPSLLHDLLPSLKFFDILLTVDLRYGYKADLLINTLNGFNYFGLCVYLLLDYALLLLLS